MAFGDMYAGVDFGSYSIKIVTTIETKDGIKIDNYNEIASQGIERGEVIDVNLCYKKLDDAISQFSKKINTITVNLSSASIIGIKSSGFTKISGKISNKDIQFAMESSKDYDNFKKQNRKIFTVPFGFKINRTVDCKHPIGVKAKHLAVDYYLLSIDNNVVNNIYNLVEKTSVETENEVISSIASGNFVLTAEQRRNGVCLVDIGAGVCDLIVFKNNKIQINTVINFGGIDIDTSISDAYDCSLTEAQRLKTNYGFLNTDHSVIEKIISFKQLDNSEKSLSNYQLVEVIENNYFELLNKIKYIIKDAKIEKILNSGFVFIGGGSNIRGFLDFSRIILKNKTSFPKIDSNYLSAKGIVFDENIEFNKYYNALSLIFYKPNEDYLQEVSQPEIIETNIKRKISKFLSKIKTIT